MKIISYNVNGIRAALKKGFIEWLKSANPDVICLQEIKAQEDQLDLSVFDVCFNSCKCETHFKIILGCTK